MKGGKGRHAGGQQGPPTFVKGTGRKNMARVNPLGVAPERKKENRTLGRATLRKYMLGKKKGAMLDLSKLSSAPELSQQTCNLNSRQFVNTVLEIIAEDFPPIESLSLAGNNITTLEYFKACAEAHNLLGFVRNLDLSNNRIHSFKEVEHLKPFKLSEILMRGNPIATNLDEYAKRILTRLPTVQLVDRNNVVALRTSIKPKLPQVKASFYFMNGTQDLAFNFCNQYFKALDEQKFESDLLEAYAPDSLFTLTISRDLAIGYGVRAERILKTLRETSHNLCQLKNEAAPAKTVVKGRLYCLNVLREKVYGGMKTAHELSLFNVDSVQLQASLTTPTVVVTIHGVCEFSVSMNTAGGGKECKFKRCFDRTFVLQASPPNSSWPAVITNETLHLRPFKDPPVMKEGSDPDQPPDLEKAKHIALTKIVSETTNLTLEYAEMCLQAADWDPTVAQQLFLQQKDGLPPNAWKDGVKPN